MLRLISFGSYTFPDTIADAGLVYQDNFGNMVQRTDRLPGMDGGFDVYGDDAAPQEVGNIRFRFVLIASTAAEMVTKLDAVKGLARLGRQVLTGETHDGQERFCYAKLSNLSIPINDDVYSAQINEVVADFQVAYPRWFSDSADSPQVEACSGTATTFTITNEGTAVAIPSISIDPGTAISSSGLTIQRLVDSVVVDEVEYAAALLSTDVLVINCKALTVRKNGVDAYSTAFSADHPAWLRLLPGANSIKVILGGGEAASVTVTWADTWY